MAKKPRGLETMEFRREFEAETSRMLRRRLLWFAAIIGGIGLASVVLTWWADLFLVDGRIREQMLGGRPFASVWFPSLVLDILWIGAYAGTFAAVLWRKVAPVWVLRLSLALVSVDALYGVATGWLGMELLFGLWIMVFSHLIASMVFPWTPWQALVPVAVGVGAATVTRMFEPGATVLSVITTLVFAPLLGVPGTVICAVRHKSRLEQSSHRFFRKRYGMLRQEIAYARQIHESVFPDRFSDGGLVFDYSYEPMRDIGGDYLHARVSEPLPGDGTLSSITVTIIDVTGHGIPAAMAVNRLHGEMELLFAADPEVRPDEILRHLNRYVHLTMAPHSIYATAICLRVDAEEDTIEYGSAGHPPAFVRAVDGTLRELDSTTLVLGASPENAFVSGVRTCPFGPGDALIAFTDGAAEARSPAGRMLRVAGLRAVLAGRDKVEAGAWPRRIIGIVAEHRGGEPPADDTLVVEITRELSRAPREAPVAESAAG